MGVVRVAVVVAAAAVLLGGCAPKPALLEEESSRTDVRGPAISSSALDGISMPGAAPLEVREVRIIEDNGQQGVFAKLSGPPRDVSYITLDNPSRLVVEMYGETSGEIASQRFPVDNDLIDQIQLGSDGGKIRLTIQMRGSSVPPYTVDSLSDTLVAFIGEPQGTVQPVTEQVVFTDRALPGAAPPPPAIASVPAAGPSSGLRVPPGVGASESKAPVVSIFQDQEPVVIPPSKPAIPSVGEDSQIAIEDLIDTSPGPRAEVDSGGLDLGGLFAGQGFGRGKKAYQGQTISLDLKDADINNVIRLLADVSNLNIVATDDVVGTITLRLFDVPWDQALDIVLQVQSLESVREGNVVRISTIKRLREEREEIAKAQEAAREIEPLEVAYMRVHYHKAKLVADLISGAARSMRTRGGSGGGGGGGGAGAQENLGEVGVMSSRGSVMVDEFTNTLIVRDVERGIEAARDLVRRLDVQIPQVLIESSIVEATTDFTRDLGVQWGYNANVGPQTGTSTGHNFPGTVNFGGSGLGSGSTGVPFLFDFPANLGDSGGAALDLALGSLTGSQALNMRITALEEKGKGRVISRPRVVTLNNVPATIQSLTVLRVRLPSTGTVINTGAGGAAGAQVNATERIETGITLEVTPQVSGDGFILLDMFAKSSQADFARQVDGIPTEITRQTTSQVLVRDGQTVVLGGIYRDTNALATRGLPFFDQIPGLGWLFKSDSRIKRREDLLVFITPRVLGPYRVKNLPSASQLWQRRGGGGEPG
jgi:type IV pilus secretin PilQ/predicted competence protein